MTNEEIIGLIENGLGDDKTIQDIIVNFICYTKRNEYLQKKFD
jgi:hypothetical protein